LARASAFTGCITISLGGEIGIDALAKYIWPVRRSLRGPQSRIKRLN
jgi:hypothetical protein